MKLRFSALLFVFASALFFSFQTQAQSEMSEAPIIELLTSMADSPKDHIAIANYYQKLAKRARDEVSLHENMADKYQRNQAKIKSPSIGLAAKEHCDRIIKLQQSIAIEYEGLAELHKDAAER